MARLLTQKDVYAVINAMAKEITGQESTLQAVDTSTFISVGETILSYSKENILNSLGLLMGRILIASREYRGGFNLINAINTGLYTHRLEKISFYASDATAAGPWNTDLFTNLSEGFNGGSNSDENGDAQSVPSQWEQKYKYPLEMNFAGSSVWDYGITIPEVQLEQAFRGPDEFNEFISGMLLEASNDIETEKEAFRRAIVLNHIAGIYDLKSVMPGSCVNLTEEFNKFYFGNDTTSYYTTEQLLSTYLKEFLAFMVAEIKNYSVKFRNRSSMYHWTPPKTVGGNSLALLRHTPADKTKLFLYEPFFRKAEAMVMGEIFNDRYLSLDNYEGIEFWQNEANPTSIKISPAIPNTDTTSVTYGTQIKGSTVTLDMVIGLMFDTDALLSDFQMDRVDSTVLNPRKLYRNLWYHFSKNGINDFTEKAILFYMADPVT